MKARLWLYARAHLSSLPPVYSHSQTRQAYQERSFTIHQSRRTSKLFKSESVLRQCIRLLQRLEQRVRALVRGSLAPCSALITLNIS